MKLFRKIRAFFRNSEYKYVTPEDEWYVSPDLDTTLILIENHRKMEAAKLGDRNGK